MKTIHFERRGPTKLLSQPARLLLRLVAPLGYSRQGQTRAAFPVDFGNIFNKKIPDRRCCSPCSVATNDQMCNSRVFRTTTGTNQESKPTRLPQTYSTTITTNAINVLNQIVTSSQSTTIPYPCHLSVLSYTILSYPNNTPI